MNKDELYEVSNTLGIGYVEKVYENALVIALRKAGLNVAQQFPIKVTFEDIIVGEFFADCLSRRKFLLN